MSGRCRKLLQAAALAMIVVGVATGSASAADPEKVTLAYTSADAIYGPWFYGQEKGYFKKNGLDSTLVFIDSGTKGVQALVGGAVDICAADGNALMNAKFAGSDAVFVGADLSVLTGSVYTAKDITEPAQLKGKKWGISSFGSEANFAAVLAIKSFGLDAKDVTLVQLGNQGNRLAALDAGQIQVTTFLPPVSSKAELAGYKKMAELPKLAPDYFSIGPAVTADYLKAHRATVKNFLKGLAEATAAMAKDKEGGTAVIMKYLKSNEKDAEIAWDYYRHYEPASLQTTPNSFQIHLDFANDPKAKTLKFDDFMDLSLLKELQQEGFFKTLQ